MGLTRAQRLARQTSQWPWEVRDGKVVTLPEVPLRRRPVATRLTLLVEAAAADAGAWVTTEALIRVQRRPETALRPVLAVLKDEPPYDGVLDEVPLLVIEVGEERRQLWPDGAAATLWTVRKDHVRVDRRGGRSSVVGVGRTLTARGLPALRIPAATLCQMASRQCVASPAAPVKPLLLPVPLLAGGRKAADRGREEATPGHPH